MKGKPVVKLFPYLLVRVGGGPFQKLKSLDLTQPVQLVHAIRELELKTASVKDGISDALYQVIPSIADSKVRATMINLRRDVFNQRDISSQVVEQISPHILEETVDDLRIYLEARQKIGHLLTEGELAYSKEVVEARKNLFKLAMEDNLQMGLLLSSQSLLQSLPKYQASIARATPLTKENLKTERGLIKYISRIYAKTSPFSTFTSLGCIQMSATDTLAQRQTPPPQGKNIKPTVIGHIRLNNLLYKYLRTLLTANSQIYRWFLLRANPTLRKENGHYIYLTNSENIEAFQRVPATPVLELIQRLASSSKEGMVFETLTQTLTGHIDAPAEKINGYINQLIEYGFLEFNLGVSGIDPDWDIKLQARLKQINARDVPLISELIETLEKLRDLANQYGQAGLERRGQILKEAFEAFKETCFKLHQAAGLSKEEQESFSHRDSTRARQASEKPDANLTEEKVFKKISKTGFNFRPEQMFYEDTTVDRFPEINEKHFNTLVQSLHELLQELARFEIGQYERERMRHYFVNKYGSTASVNLLTFYEDYYREFKLPFEKQRRETQQAKRNTRESGSTDNKTRQDETAEPEKVSEPEAIQEKQLQNIAWMSQLAKVLKEQQHSQEADIHISLAHIQKVNQIIPDDEVWYQEHGSAAAFVQLCRTKGQHGQEKLKAVLNGTFVGFGKMFSRFLHLFTEEVASALLDWNQSLLCDQDVLLIENTDASYFNANIHPSLMPYEIWLPSGHNSLPADQQISVTELQVQLDEKSHQLQLVHKSTQKRAYTFDLGFQSLSARSKLYQLLDAFTLAEKLHTTQLRDMTDELLQRQQHTKKAIWIKPRVVYKDQIVLQRKTWLIPQRLLPLKRPQESDWAYFARINTWRLELGIPDRVFVWVLDRLQPEDLSAENPEALRQRGRDDYKPQYISFKNPFLVDLFDTLLRKVANELRIEEMLPGPEEILTIDGDRYVTEIGFQWYYHRPERDLE